MLRRKQKGQSLVEFALILPVLLLILLGIIEGAWVIWSYITVQNAAREAARYAVTGQPLDDKGEPWTFTPEQRVEAIKQVARDAAGGLPIEVYADMATEGQDFEDTQFANQSETPKALGILVSGQITPEDIDPIINHPGNKGLYVQVDVYYNVVMMDPLFDTIMGGEPINLKGQVVMQNEGVNLALGGKPPDFAPGQTDTEGGGSGQGSFEDIEVRYEGQTVAVGGEVPAGSFVDVFLSGHAGGDSYYICFDGASVPPSPVTIYPNNTYLLVGFNIPLSTSPVPGTHTFTSSPNADCSSPVASASITVVPAVNASVTISDIGHEEHPWPDNSLVDVRLAAHDPNQVYDIYFDGALMPVGDGTADTCQILSDSSGAGLTTCAIPDGLPVGTYPMTTTFANNVVDVINAGLEVRGGQEWPDGALVELFLDEHAPEHPYHIYAGTSEIMASIPDGIYTNSTGRQTIYFRLPSGFDGQLALRTQDRQNPAPPSAVRLIASTSVSVTTSTTPQIVVVGGYDWPAGEVIQIELHNHTPNTTYDIVFGSGVGVNEVAVGTVTTNADGDFIGVLSFQIPVDTTAGTWQLISYFENSTSYETTQNLNISATPSISIDNGNEHVPLSEITINLTGHAGNSSYDVYLDLNSDGALTPDELIEANIITQSDGSASFTYVIPDTISPVGLDPADAHRIVSMRAGQEVAETDLYVVEADLTITAITPPNDPQPGVEMPVAVTIKNNSSITLTGFPFDNDIFINPDPGVPSSGNSVPPGDEKIWISEIGPLEEIVITPSINIYNMGIFTLFGKTDASNTVSESSEFNNILSNTLTIACNLPTTEDDFADDTQQGSWTMTTFGSSTLYGPWAGLSLESGTALAAVPMAPVQPAVMQLSLPPALPVAQGTPQPVHALAEPAGADPGAYAAQAAVLPPAAPLLQTNEVSQISSNGDDAEEQSDGYTYRWTSELGFGVEPVGMRFQNIGIPQGAYIYSADIRFVAYANDTQSTSLTFYGHDVDDSNQFTNGAYYDITGRTRTTASVPWNNVPNWSSGSTYDSPDLTGIVQEIVNRGGWSNNNEMTFIVLGSGQRQAWSYNGNPSNAATLRIQWSNTPPPPTATPTPTVPAGCSSLSVAPATGPLSTFVNEFDVGGSTPGFSGENGGVVYVCGSGGDIWGGADAFRYVYANNSGDVTLTARVSAWDGSANSWAKGGLMIRNSEASNAAHAMVVVTQNNGIRMQWRSADGNNSNSTGANIGFGVPVWLRLAKVGNTITTYYSTNGSTWNQVGSQNISLNTSYQYGFAVTSHDNSRHAAARFDNISTSAGPTPTATATATNTPISGGSCSDPNSVWQESAGQVVMEAEHGDSVTAGGQTWQSVTSPSGYSGTGAMQVDDNNVNRQLDVSNSPYVEYRINFSAAGNYNVYVRGLGPSGDDDSLHAGLNSPVTNPNVSGNRGLEFGNSYEWDNTYGDANTPAVINIPSAGEHTFRVWMREDGTIFDKIVLKQSAGTPSDAVAESSCSALPTATPTPPPTATATPDASFAPPTNLSATAGTNGLGDPIIDLQWNDNSSDEDGFIIQRLNGATWEELDRTGSNATTYQDSTVVCGTTYMYRVLAFRNDGTISLPSPLDTEPVVSATTAACPVAECTNSTMSEGLTLCSNGAGAMLPNDNSGGYLFMNRFVDSYSFDMAVRLNSVPGLNSQSMAGLEVRENRTSGTSRKVDLVVRNENTQQVGAFTRSTDGGAVSQLGGWANTGGDVPVWLRIVRANGQFVFYYNTSDETMPVVGAWTQFAEAPDTMGEDVYVGLINVAASGTRGASTWQDFRIGCLPNTLSRETCGPVTEDDGQVVINAINYTDNFVSRTSSNTWNEISSGGYPAMSYYSGSNYDLDEYFSAPMLEYAANIEQAGTYYIWLLAYTRNNGDDEIYLGLDGGLVTTMEDHGSGDSRRWFNTDFANRPITLNLSQGVHVFNLWGAEDRIEVHQIMLTTSPPSSYTPSGNTPLPQSECLVPVPPEFPPNLQQCTQVLQNTGFEDGLSSPFVWNTGQSELDKADYGAYAYPSTGNNFGMRLRVEPLYVGGPIVSPRMEQSFNMPNWILPSPDSRAELSLHKAVDKYSPALLVPENSPGDKVYVILRDQAGTDLTPPVELATGADNPDADDLSLANWTDVTDLDLLPSVTVDPVNLAGDQLTAYFYAQTGPGNPTDDYGSSHFFVDDVTLDICTTQPEPPAQAGTGEIYGQLSVLSSGIPQMVSGVTVWAYKMDGAMYTTYTINAGAGQDNYSFHNLEPGQYTIYASFTNSNGDEFGASSSVNVIANQPHYVGLILVPGG